MKRIKETVLIVAGVMAGVLLSGPAASAVARLTATPSSGASVMLDRQGAVVTQTEIGTRGAFISRRQQDNRMVVLMFDNDYAYTLTSYLEQGEAVAVMESIPGAG